MRRLNIFLIGVLLGLLAVSEHVQKLIRSLAEASKATAKSTLRFGACLLMLAMPAFAQLLFDGVDDYASTSYMGASSYSGTISLWAYVTASTMRVLVSSGNAAVNNYLRLSLNANRVQWEVNHSMVSYSSELTTATIPDGWRHIAVIASSGSTRIGIDGVIVPSYMSHGRDAGKWFGDIPARNNFLVGKLSASGEPALLFTNRLDAVTVYAPITSNQLAHYVLNTASRYSYPLSTDTNLLAIAEPWDYTAGNASCLLALDTENLGVADGVAVATNAVIRDRSSYANDATANGAPVHVLPDRSYTP